MNTLLSDGSTPIAIGEPVFVVRASDQAFVSTLQSWVRFHLAAGGDPEMAKAVGAHVAKAIEWQAINRCKLADAPQDTLK